MSHCISCGCRTDIATFYISDYHKVFGVAVIYCLLICFHTLCSKLLIHGNLWFYSRNQIISGIYNCFVKLPDCFCCTL